ncbi:MAG: VWA domain-containing protein [Firmicutes bacterium]|nr:VWA domain-containing protein [Bacillota bacterium]
MKKEYGSRNNKLTELVMIIDRSGSMSGMEESTIEGYNKLLKEQKAIEGEVLVSTVLFDHEVEVLHDRLPIRKVNYLTHRDYQTRGCTALLDAVGGAIHHIARLHKHTNPKYRPGRTLFVIITDGMENASRRYTYPQVKQLIDKEKEKYDWEFLFLGANIDAARDAGRMGIDADHAVDYHSDARGTQLNYEVLSRAVGSVRMSRAPLSKGWKKDIDADYKRRKK